MRHLAFTCLFAAACFSPNQPATGATAGEDESSSTNDPSTTTMTGTTASGTTVSTTAGDTGSSGQDDTSTTADPTTSADGSGSSGDPPAPFCGDGIVGPTEDCDDGEENALTAACRPDCTMASCGDGDIWEGVEGCDFGEGDNVLEVGACAPDCSRVIEVRVIRTGGAPEDGDFGNNPVAFADSLCAADEAAMFAYPNIREAALDEFDASRSLDWVIQPYTAYTNEDGAVVWITDAVPLLGVRDGVQQPLLAAVLPCDPDSGFCIWRVVSGLDDGWVTRVTNTCELWTNSSSGDARVGNPHLTSGILDTGETRSCGSLDSGRVLVYCAQQ